MEFLEYTCPAIWSTVRPVRDAEAKASRSDPDIRLTVISQAA